MTLAARNNYEFYFTEPKPTRATTPEGIAKEVDAKKKDRHENAPFFPVAGTVTACVILDEAGKEVFAASGGFDSTPGEISVQALQVITSCLEADDKLLAPLELYDVSVRLFGLKIRERLRVLALDAFRYGLEHKQKIDIPVGLWYNRTFEPSLYLDPYEVVVPSERRNDISFDGLCRFLDIELDPSANVDTSPTLQAELARQIALRCQLFPQ